MLLYCAAIHITGDCAMPVLTFELKIGTPITFALGNVQTNVGFPRPFCIQVWSKYRTERQTIGLYHIAACQECSTISRPNKTIWTRDIQEFLLFWVDTGLMHVTEWRNLDISRTHTLYCDSHLASWCIIYPELRPSVSMQHGQSQQLRSKGCYLRHSRPADRAQSNAIRYETQTRL